MYAGNMIHDFLTVPAQGAVGGYVSVTAAADVLRFSPSRPIFVWRWGFIATTTVNDATNTLKLTLDTRVKVGTDVGRVTGSTTTVASSTGYNASGSPAFLTDTAGGSLTLTAGATQVVAGKGVFHEMNPQATISPELLYPRPDTAFVAPGGVNTQLVIYPGQELVMAIQPVAPVAGAGIFFVEYIHLPFQGLGYGSGTAQIVPSNISPTPSNAIANLTRVQS